MQDSITTTTTKDQTVIVIRHQQPTPITHNQANQEHKDWQMLIFFAVVIALGLAAISGD